MECVSETTLWVALIGGFFAGVLNGWVRMLTLNGRNKLATAMDERCKGCKHWTDRKSEFDGWQLCNAMNVWKHAEDWCKQFKRK